MSAFTFNFREFPEIKCFIIGYMNAIYFKIISSKMANPLTMELPIENVIERGIKD